LEKRFGEEPDYVDDQPQQSLTSNDFDYRKFFDFGFFTNAAANFGGAPLPAAGDAQVLNVQKQIDPNTIFLEKTVIPGRYKRSAHNAA